MNGLFGLLILAAAAGAPTPQRSTEAIEIYSSNFEHDSDRTKDSDVNYDGWPDGWTRRVGRGFPRYVPMAIRPDTSTPGNHCLQIELNGGAAEAFGPLREISHLFSYELRGRLRTEGLEHDKAFLSVTFLDAQGKVLETHYSERFTVADDWIEVGIPPVTPRDPSARQARVGVHLHPQENFDLYGKAMFDDIWLDRLPRMDLRANKAFHIYHDPQQIQITCHISGIRNTKPEVVFELLDVYGETVAVETRSMKPHRLAGEAEEVDELVGDSTEGIGFRNETPWTPPISSSQFGYYQIRASIKSGGSAPLTRVISLAVVRKLNPTEQGEFGWSFPKGEDPLPLRQLALLVEQAAVNWVKLPIWFGKSDDKLADRIAWFAERMSSSGVNLVGVLDQPPVPADHSLSEGSRPPIALVFGDEGVWKPLINPVMTRLSLKMRWWQLGADHDVSYIGFPNLVAKISEIKKHLERFGQEIRLGFNWRWMNQPPPHKKPPWRFVSFSVDPPFTANELASALKAQKDAHALRWVTLRPLKRGKYGIDVRARDLVLRMLAAKINGANAVFVSNPFDSEQGLMREDGTPSELFLPWRTTASMVAGGKFQGAIQLPNGSYNYVFSRNGQAVLAIWGDRSTKETIYLGENVRAVDVWGRETSPQTAKSADGIRRQVIEVGHTPVFLVGVNLAIARWRMSFAFNREQLTSMFGTEQPAQYQFLNPFPRGVSGNVRLHTPAEWEVRPPVHRFDLSQDESREFPIRIKLGTYASSGAQKVRADFDVVADRQYRFSAYRTIQVGQGDITIEVHTQINPTTGDLIVRLDMHNKTDERARFNCLLFIESRKRQRTRITTSGRGRTSTSFTVARGAELIGEMIFVRVTEIGGTRNLNSRVRVRP